MTTPIAPVAADNPVDNMSEFKAKVEKLSVMKDAGLLSEEEYNAMKTKLLSADLWKILPLRT